MQIVKIVFYWLLEHWPDVVIAIVLAVIADLLRIGSAIRSGARQIKNRLAEQSVERLRKRIADLEKYQNTVKLYASSDKALYLSMFRFIIAIPVVMCIGAVLALMDTLGVLPNGNIGAICVFSLTVGVGIQAMRFASLDTERKLFDFIAKLGGEIAALQEKLRRRTQ